MSIGERIRAFRDGWMTQQQLATRADVSVDLVRKLEQEQRHTASVPSLQALAAALDTDPATLLAGTRDRHCGSEGRTVECRDTVPPAVGSNDIVASSQPASNTHQPAALRLRP